MSKGVYILLFFTSGSTILVGALGEVAFAPGWYAYVGSALGPAGLARVNRHIRLSELHDKNPRWHVDYLLMDSRFRLDRVYIAETEERAECFLAGEMTGMMVTGFGSSDCSCRSHLFYWNRDPDGEIRKGFSACGLIPVPGPRILP